MKRKKTRIVRIGDISIGGEYPVAVQSMTSTATTDTEATVRQIKLLEEYGCELIRVAVPDDDSVRAIPEIKKKIRIPLIADIHFRADLAVRAIKNGVDKIRINPGNISDKDAVAGIITCAKEHDIPIRIGVNAGSLPPDILKKHNGPSAKALIETISRYIVLFERQKFRNLVISLKSFDIDSTIDAYRMFSQHYDYPTHVGITESGPVPRGVVRSALGIGILLREGIGDTMRVSLTAAPEQEVIVAYEILRSLKIREVGPCLISCPTCARTDLDIISITEEVERRLRRIKSPLKVAVMGCEVNGPGEARMADVGIAGGKNGGVLFVSGEIIGRVSTENMVDKLMEKVEEIDRKYKDKTDS